MNTKICPVCKTPIPANAPGGLCPACILRDADEPAPAGRAAPPLAEIASAFPQLEIESLIGQGGMGFVYKARQPSLDRVVALKILAPELSRDPAFAERFAREARVLGKLSHPNIVSIFEHGETGGFYYLLMELVDGVNLRQAMRAGRFTPAQALAIVPGICDALQAAHAQGVWHRDIKPENILLDARGGVKIADFGIARIVGDPGRDFTLTATGAALGSAAYMAPEQHEKPHDVDHRADIYSLGVVIYEMLTGELPLGRFPAPSHRAAVDARIDEIVFRTLEKERELRQQSASEVKADMTHAGVPSSAAAAPPSAPSTRFSRTAIVGAGLMALGFLSGFLSLFVDRTARAAGPAASAAPALFGAGLLYLFAAAVLGWIAVAQIRRSAGKLYGMGLAVFDGLLLPLLVLDIFLTLFFYTLGIACHWWTQNPGEQSSAALIAWSCVTLLIVDFFIIRRVWRAVNGRAHTPAPQSASNRGSEPPVSLQPTIIFHAILFALVAAIFFIVIPRFGEILRDMGVPRSYVPRVGLFHEALGILIFTLLFGIDVGMCFLVRKIGGRRGLHQWTVAFIVLMVSIVAVASGALYLPLKSVIDTFGAATSAENSKRAGDEAFLTSIADQRLALLAFPKEYIRELTEAEDGDERRVLLDAVPTLARSQSATPANKNSAEETLRITETATLPAKPVFGPVVERSLYFSDNMRTYLDFQSGESSRAQWALTALPTDEAQKAWLKNTGVDAYAIEPITNKDAQTSAVVREHPRLSSWSGGCVFALVPHSQAFDDPRAEDMEARLKESTESAALMGGTYWFKTSDGAKGIVHLYGINDSPPQVQLRYRLLATEPVAKDVESWSYTLRHWSAERFESWRKIAISERAEWSRGISIQQKAGIITVTGPRERVRRLATMLRAQDQPDVNDPLQLPLLNMPPDFFTQMAIPSLMNGTEFSDTQFEPEFFETLKRENITAPQLARALSAHVLELEKATFVNTGTPFESIMKIPGASTFYDGTIPCADQPDKPLTLRIRRTTQTMGTKPDIAGLAPWLIEEAKQQSKEAQSKPSPQPRDPSNRRRVVLPTQQSLSPSGTPVKPELESSIHRGGATPLETILRLSELANANDKERFKQYLAMNVPPAEVDGYVAERLDAFTGKIVGVWRTGAERRLGTQLDRSAPHPMYWFERERDGKRVFIQCFISVDKGRCLNFSQMSAPYRATARIEFRPTEGDPLRILRGVLPENSAFEVEQFFADAAPVAGQFNARSYAVPSAEDAAAKANELTQLIGNKVKALGQDSTYRVIKAATVPERPEFFTMPNLEQLFPETAKIGQ